MARAIEKALVKAIPVLIGFLASLVGITGLTARIQKIIGKVRKKIDKVITKIIKKAKKAFGKLVKKGKAKVKGAVEKVINWWKKRKDFKAKNGDKHEIFFKKKGKQFSTMVASETPYTLEKHIRDKKAKRREHPFEEGQEAKLNKALELSKELIATFEANYKKQEREETVPDITRDLETKLGLIAQNLKEGGLFVGEMEVPPTKVTFAMEAGKSKNVTASPLTKIPGNTQGDGSSSGLFPKGETLKKAANDEGTGNISTTTGEETKKRDWKHVHLLSHLLHGPYTLWNIVIGNTSLNSAFTKFEHGTREGKGSNFAGKSVKENYVYHYEVNVKYHAGEEIKDKNGIVIGDKSDYPDKIFITIKRKQNMEDNWEPVSEGTPIDPHMDLTGFEHLEVTNTKVLDTHGAVPTGDPNAARDAKLASLKSQVEDFIRIRKAKGELYNWGAFSSRRDIRLFKADSKAHWQLLYEYYDSKKTEIDNE